MTNTLICGLTLFPPDYFSNEGLLVDTVTTKERFNFESLGPSSSSSFGMGITGSIRNGFHHFSQLLRSDSYSNFIGYLFAFFVAQPQFLETLVTKISGSTLPPTSPNSFLFLILRLLILPFIAFCLVKIFL